MRRGDAGIKDSPPIHHAPLGSGATLAGRSRAGQWDNLSRSFFQDGWNGIKSAGNREKQCPTAGVVENRPGHVNDLAEARTRVHIHGTPEERLLTPRVDGAEFQLYLLPLVSLQRNLLVQLPKA